MGYNYNIANIEDAEMIIRSDEYFMCFRGCAGTHYIHYCDDKNYFLVKLMNTDYM